MKGVRLNLYRGGVIGVALALALVFANCSSSTGGGGGGDKGKNPGNGGDTPEGGGTPIESDIPSNTQRIVGPDILSSSYVNLKYANGANDSRANQTAWNAANCHDPKLFQDDDGTYYVYATDASCGNIGYVGLHIRSSKDLINWTGVATSALAGYWDKDFLAWEGFKASSVETKQDNTEYTAYTWAPTVIKQNDLYYMYHGVNADVKLSGGGTKWASSICLAIASKPTGPFYPASFISNYTSGSGTYGNDADISFIKSKLNSLGVTYKQNFLVRYNAVGSSARAEQSTLDGNKIPNPDYTDANNGRFGCIDPEFVYDMATGKIMEYTIGSNTCYAIIYGSWLNGIALAYVDSVSLKPVYKDTANHNINEITIDGVTYKTGDPMDIPLDKASTWNGFTTGNYACLGERIAGGYGAGYEGAQLFYNSNTNYYYLITSCGGLDYEYRCTLGRSDKIEGPYFDAGGQNMVLTQSNAANYHAIGSKIIGSHVLKDEYSFRCQGGLSVWRNKDGEIIFANHARTNFQEGYYFYLQCHQMFFNADGWPVLNQNEYYNNYAGLTQDGKESLTKLTVADVAGTYDTILTVRGTDTATVSSLGIYGASDVSSKVNKQDAVPTASKGMVLESDGSISGNYTGTWQLASDGYSITIDLKDTSGSTLGRFKGIVMYAVDWARKTNEERFTITFSTLCYDESGRSAKAGEFFWGNRQAVPQWSVSGNTYTYNGESTASVAVPKINVTASEGFTVSFKATLPVYTKDADWGTKIFSYKGCHVTIPNLDPYNNTISGSKLTGKNSFPSAAGASMGSGLAFNSAFGGTHTIKIVFTSNTVTFYLDGKTWVTYSSSALSNGMQEFVGYYITGLNAGEVTFNEAGMNITNLTISKGTN
ncbi:MAG: glycoside hydrolase family 43 protein [Treponema sp.]|nr:glycoside hydrolase family 43 protein [Treponema sp.]